MGSNGVHLSNFHHSTVSKLKLFAALSPRCEQKIADAQWLQLSAHPRGKMKPKAVRFYPVWWFFPNPSEKYATVKLESFPNFGVKIKIFETNT